jgi:hypothetical protein
LAHLPRGGSYRKLRGYEKEACEVKESIAYQTCGAGYA